MDDRDFGTRDRRGYWTPSEPLKTAPLWVWPPRPGEFLRWLPGYFLPWNLFFLATGIVWWVWLTPPRETLQTLHWTWIAALLLRNACAVLLFYGAFELRLYTGRAQGTAFKFNAAFPADAKSRAFLFNSQNRDGILRTFLSGVPVWTGYEVLMLWAWANGIGPWTTFTAHPVWLCILILLIPMIHDIHFYLVHRLIHMPVLYRHIHSVHHASVNPSPWSSLAMHPVEHLLYFSGALIHFILPSHPLIVLYHLNYAGLGAVVGHIGYDRILAGDDKTMSTHAFSHYLHHRYFEVNYADGPTPLDKWFGTWHDGTPEGDARMQARRMARRRTDAV